MAVMTAQRVRAVEREARTRPLGDLAAYLQETVGQSVAAHLAGVEDAKEIGRYARAEAKPNELVDRRMREGYKVVRMLADAWGPKTAQTWLFGTNPDFDDHAPIGVLERATDSDEFAAVVRSARQFASADW